MAVTLKQIADAAGVSRGTVDRALNNRGRIRPEVAQEIKKLAQEMGYQPSRAGRALSMSHRKIKIGVILHSAETPFMQQVKKGVEAAEKEVEGFGGSVELRAIESVDAAKSVAIMEEMRASGINGIAISPPEDLLLRNLVNQYAQDYQIPIVTFNSDLLDTKRLCFVGQDTKRCGQAAAGLMGQILPPDGAAAIISGHSSNPALNQRVQGFEEELRAAFPHIHFIGTRYSYDDDWVSGKIVDELLATYPALSGIYLAGPGEKGVCSALEQAGKKGVVKVIANEFTAYNTARLADGTIQFLIGQDAYVQGYDPVMILFRYLLDGTRPEKECWYADLVIKTKYNID